MGLNFGPASTLMLLGALQSLFLTFALIEKRKRRSPANRVLSVLMFLTAVRLANAALFYSSPGGVSAFGLGWTVPLILTFPPLLFLYVQALTQPGFRFRRAQYLHFLPAFFCLLWNIPFYVESLGLRSMSSLAGGERQAAWAEAFLNAAWLTQTAVYLILIIRLRRRHIRSSSRLLSSVAKVHLDWIRNLAAGFAFLAFLVLLYLFHVSFGLPLPGVPGVFLHLSIAAVILAWGYSGLRQPEIFGPGRMPMPERGPEPPESPADSAADEAVRRLLDFMEAERPYLDADLTLFDLARAVSFPPYQLSALLNKRLGQTFFEFVNARRIEEAKRKLRDPSLSRLKILALALECGFNSKSAFNRVFKEMTGRTPSQYQRGR